MNEAIDDLPVSERLRCQTPIVKQREDGRKYLYFPHMDYDERTPPTPAEAELMCTTAGVPCPVAEQCLALALAQKSAVGVWGGKTFVDGEIL